MLRNDSTHNRTAAADCADFGLTLEVYDYHGTTRWIIYDASTQRLLATWLPRTGSAVLQPGNRSVRAATWDHLMRVLAPYQPRQRGTG